MSDGNAAAEALVPKFKFERLLNQDQAGRRSSLYGSIDGQPALLVLERAPFPSSADYLGSVAGSLRSLHNLGANDIYHWYLASSGDATPTAAPTGSDAEQQQQQQHAFADLKINLIYPCTDKHIRKYSKQGVRFVSETPAIYRERVRPYMEAQRAAGRLNWVYNILDGTQEAEQVIYRTPASDPPDEEGFLLLPDLNWDRRTLSALHLLALPTRRDLWSLRDLRRGHVPWLRSMRARLVAATTRVYPSVEPDQLKLYVHYQPTYYHLHVHIVHVQLEAGATQATGKAVGLESVIAQLESMGRGGVGNGRGDGDGNDDTGREEDVGMDSVTLCYTLGEASDLWVDVFEPLKREELEKEEEEEKKKKSGTASGSPPPGR